MINQAVLVGRLTRDPEMATKGDIAYSRFSIAVQRPFKNDDGEYGVDFFNCVAFNKTAEFIDNNFGKGDFIGVVGRLQTGSYVNKDGVKIPTTEVNVEKASFTSNKSDSSSGTKSERPKKSRDYDDENEYEKPKKKHRSDDDDEDYSKPKKKRSLDDDEEYEKPKKKRKSDPDEEDEDYDYPF